MEQSSTRIVSDGSRISLACLYSLRGLIIRARLARLSGLSRQENLSRATKENLNLTMSTCCNQTHREHTIMRLYCNGCPEFRPLYGNKYLSARYYQKNEVSYSL